MGYGFSFFWELGSILHYIRLHVLDLPKKYKPVGPWFIRTIVICSVFYSVF